MKLLATGEVRWGREGMVNEPKKKGTRKGMFRRL